MLIGTYRLVQDCRHDVGENSELEEEAKLHTSLVNLHNALLAQVVDQTQTFETVAHELGQVVVEMFVQKLKVLLDVSTEFLNIIEYFPEAFLDQSQQPSELDVSQTRDHEVCHGMVLVPKQDGELSIFTARK